MMVERNDGGQAFPSVKSSLMRDHAREPHRFTHDYASEGGMTLRDWFAGQALAGMLTETDRFTTRANRDYGAADGETNAEYVARNCYAFSDAMLAERSK